MASIVLVMGCRSDVLESHFTAAKSMNKVGPVSKTGGGEVTEIKTVPPFQRRKAVSVTRNKHYRSLTRGGGFTALIEGPWLRSLDVTTSDIL
jgi:hypothetical protein